MEVCSLRNTFAGGDFRGSVRITEPRKRKLLTSARSLRSALALDWETINDSMNR